MKLTAAALAMFEAHALAEYPREACGFLTQSGYYACINVAPDPKNAFKISGDDYLRAGKILAVVHSHTDGSFYPSAADIDGQMRSGLPWGIALSNGEQISPLVFFGDRLPIPDLVGRGFRHGPSGSDGKGDCYALIRDWYRLHRKILLPEFPRAMDWWHQGQDLYRENFARAGFTPLRQDEMPRQGDVALMRIIGSVPVIHHGAIYLGNGLILHHLQNHLSNREPVTRWQKHIKLWVRHGTTE